MKSYFSEVFLELSKIKWISKKELLQGIYFILAVILVFALIFSVLDILIIFLLKRFI
jgi:preprotein translocase SecE subunit